MKKCPVVILTLVIWLGVSGPASAAEPSGLPSERSALSEDIGATLPLFSNDLFARTELYFGSLRSDKPPVSEQDFLGFLNDTITPFFPNGLTLLTGLGQFLNSQGVIQQEQSWLLILLYPPGSGGTTTARSKRFVRRIRRLLNKSPCCARTAAANSWDSNRKARKNVMQPSTISKQESVTTPEPNPLERSGASRLDSRMNRPTAVCVATMHTTPPRAPVATSFPVAGALGDGAGSLSAASTSPTPGGMARSASPGLRLEALDATAVPVRTGVQTDAVVAPEFVTSFDRHDLAVGFADSLRHALAAVEPQPQLELRVRAIYAVDDGVEPAWTWSTSALQSARSWRLPIATSWARVSDSCRSSAMTLRSAATPGCDVTWCSPTT